MWNVVKQNTIAVLHQRMTYFPHIELMPRVVAVFYLYFPLSSSRMKYSISPTWGMEGVEWKKLHARISLVSPKWRRWFADDMQREVEMILIWSLGHLCNFLPRPPPPRFIYIIGPLLLLPPFPSTSLVSGNHDQNYSIWFTQFFLCWLNCSFAFTDRDGYLIYTMYSSFFTCFVRPDICHPPTKIRLVREFHPLISNFKGGSPSNKYGCPSPSFQTLFELYHLFRHK